MITLNKLENLKTLAIAKRREHKESGESGHSEVEESVDTFISELKIISDKRNLNDAFEEIAFLAKKEHEWHKENLEWSWEEIENSLVELSIEIESLQD